ncbi:C14orf169 [Cordylochernes scorpioides]|uniref:Bifunctional lysine-specific demethylase and histidyl-hydroxylase n=1 Tax=Cordylochernes scorpioides TaxID=51811 RepID=A0ABY6KX00_9ARAC|nr:C14orf169 [Cordylochernes scorpioides]
MYSSARSSFPLKFHNKKQQSSQDDEDNAYDNPAEPHKLTPDASKEKKHRTSATNKKKPKANTLLKPTKVNADNITISPKIKDIKYISVDQSQPVPEHQLTKESRDPLEEFDSAAEAKRCFTWLIHPVEDIKFYNELWEKKPLLVKRHQPQYYKGIFTCKDLDRVLREKRLVFKKDIEIISHLEYKRQVQNLEGRAYPAIVWDCYQNGCNINFVSPQTYIRAVWKLGSILQEYFESAIKLDIYLTPPGSQGYAPRFSDAESFILQLEGKNIWKLYGPRNASEELPRYSASVSSKMELVDPILTVELEPGDLLYFPRGVIHKSSTAETQYSLHILLSTCKRNTWGDLLEKLVPRALRMAIVMTLSSAILCRRTSWDTWASLTSISTSQSETSVDQLAKEFIHDSLPPVLTANEKANSIYGNGEKWVDEGRIENIIELEPDTLIRLLRLCVVRLVMENDSVRLYHSLDNSRIFHEVELQYIEIGAELAPAVEYLIHVYPHYTTIEKLPLLTLEQKLEVASLLYDKGLLLIKDVPYKNFDN